MPALAEGIELVGEFEGTAYREPPQLICRSDGQLVRLPPLLYLIVKALDSHPRPGGVDGRQALSQVAEAVSQETGRHFTADHITYLVDNKIAPLGVTTYSDGSQPAIAKPKPPWLSLRFRAALLPETATSSIGGLFAWLFHPAVLFLAVPAVVASEVWLFATQSVGAALQEILLAPASILLIIFLSLVSATFHEFGHAAACRYGGVRPGAMGCGIYLVWPAVYTDVTNAYRLGRRGRLRTDLGGVYFNGLFIIGLTVFYFYTGFGPLLVAVIVTNLEMIRQLLPTLRFDGYYIASDLVGIPDLFKYIGPILKRTILRLPPDRRLRALKRWPQQLLTIWVLVVIPALAAQLSLIAFQIPGLLQMIWEMITKLALGATESRSFLGTVSAVVQILFLLLPVAGLAMLAGLAIRGIIGIVRRRAQRASPRHAHRAAPEPREKHRERRVSTAPALLAGFAGAGGRAKHGLAWVGRRAPVTAAAAGVGLSVAVAYGVTQLPTQEVQEGETTRTGAPPPSAPAAPSPTPGGASPAKGGSPSPHARTAGGEDSADRRQGGGAEDSARSAAVTADEDSVGAGQAGGAEDGASTPATADEGSGGDSTRDADGGETPASASSPGSSEDGLCLGLDELGQLDACLSDQPG